MSVNKTSKHYDKYYDHVLDKNKTSGSLGKVFDIITDLTDRRGLRQEWESIDADIQDEIINNWKTIIES